jgi:opacity protein-like surface antigen
MKKILTIAAFALAITPPAAAQNWSLGARTGAFVFGDFVERKLRPVNGAGDEEPITLTLSAETSPGLSIDVERSFAPRWGVRLEGTFTRSDMKIKQDGSDQGVTFGAGEITVTSFSVPLVFRINPNGTFRFHLMGGPAYVMYEFEAEAHQPNVSIPGETRNEWGAIAGAGVAWWMSDRFAIEGSATDIVTSSPFEEADNTSTPGVDAKRPHNLHTTIGVRWRF